MMGRGRRGGGLRYCWLAQVLDFCWQRLLIAAMKLSRARAGIRRAFEIARSEFAWSTTATTFSRWGHLPFISRLFARRLLNEVVAKLLEVNILWGVINLLPVFPLDGGQISRELFNLKDPRNGTNQALQLSAGIAVLLAAYALLNQRFYVALMFGYLAYSNFQTLQFYRNRWR